MKTTLSILTFLLLTILFVQCDKSDDPAPSGVDFSCQEHPVTCDLTEANGNFAIDLFKQMHSEEPDDNIFISPFSISTALSMTLNGADGQTYDDMRNTLRISNLGMSAVNDSYKQLLEVLPAMDPETKLKLANSVWPKINYPVLDTFLQLNTEYFHSEVIPTDFSAPGVIDDVNGWIEENTDGLIKEALQQLPPDVVMLLINAIYFKGSWMTEFDPDKTHKADFYAKDGVEQVDMMYIEENPFGYFENDLFQAVDLPYGDSIFSMSVFLPKVGHEVGEIITAMDTDAWQNWTQSFVTQPVQLYLPKFKMEYGKKLKPTLSDLGMEIAFSDYANFSRMIEGGGVRIDEVIHKAFVEVNEEGTEAAAVTIVIIVETSAGSVKTFRADHPFLFVIRDNKTNSILFMGKMMNNKN